MLTFSIVIALTLGAVAEADPPPPRPIEVKSPARQTPVSYARDLADVLADKCTGCHGSASLRTSFRSRIPPR